MKFNKKHSPAFTLIELLVVIAIIGVLATMMLSSINEALSKARDAQRHRDIRTIQTALEMYYLDYGRYPVRSWTRSYSTNVWNSFGDQLGMVLPVDPINENTAYSYDGGKNYIYYSLGTAYLNCPEGQWYMLFYSPERIIDPSESPGVIRCDTGALYKIGASNNAITVGRSPRW